MDQEDRPFADVFEVLRYVKQCHPRFDDDTSARFARGLFYVSRFVGWTGAALLVTPFVYGFKVGFVAKLTPADHGNMDLLLLIAMACLLVFFLLWIWEGQRSFPPRLGRRWEILARRSDRRGRVLLERSRGNVPLLNYAKDILKEDADDLEWSSGSIGKDVGLLAIGALASSMIKGWIDFKTYVLTAHWVGVNAAELVSSVAMLLGYAGLSLVIIVWFVRAVSTRVHYHMGLIDTAFRLKELDEEKATAAAVLSPTDNA
jgi:hypothetical protein